jgi:catechol 2,3-dioxygenase-like lactoylglutathione lyase family enzyme
VAAEPPTAFGLSFHHLGLAVPRPDEAVTFLSGLGYEIGEHVFDPEQNVNLALCRRPDMPAVEIIWPGNGPGPIDKYVARHAGGIVYHACFTTSDLAASIAAMEAAKLRLICVSPPRPAVLFDGRAVSFHAIVGMGLIEILE